MITEEQRLERRKGIGGSDIAALLGLSVYVTPYELYLEKLGLLGEDKESNLASRTGQFLEPFVCELYEEITGEKLKVKGEVPTKCDATYPYMRANVDGILQNGALFEAKTTSVMNRKEWGMPGTGQIPHAHALQVAYYASIYDAPYVDVAVLFGNSEFHIYKYTRNEKLEKIIRNKVKEFWEENVLKEVPPIAQSREDLSHIYPSTLEGSTIQITPDLFSSWTSFLNTRSEIELLEAEKDKHYLNLIRFMEDKEVLIDGSEYLASFKYNKGRSSVDIEALKINDPLIYRKYQKIGKPTRTFRVLT